MDAARMPAPSSAVEVEKVVSAMVLSWLTFGLEAGQLDDLLGDLRWAPFNDRHDLIILVASDLVGRVEPVALQEVFQRVLGDFVLPGNRPQALRLGFGDHNTRLSAALSAFLVLDPSDLIDEDAVALQIFGVEV